MESGDLLKAAFDILHIFMALGIAFSLVPTMLVSMQRCAGDPAGDRAQTLVRIASFDE